MACLGFEAFFIAVVFANVLDDLGQDILEVFLRELL
jgi:hypothetical protein